MATRLKLEQEMPSSETERNELAQSQVSSLQSPGFPDPAGTDQGNWALGSDQVKTAPFDPPKVKWS